MVESTKQRLVKLAIEHFGRTDLAKRLKTSGERLDAWDSGEAVIPNPKLLTIIDLLDQRNALGDEPSAPRPPSVLS
jgi:hypothetical protein